jgi:hypothetical protein
MITWSQLCSLELPGHYSANKSVLRTCRNEIMQSPTVNFHAGAWKDLIN